MPDPELGRRVASDAALHAPRGSAEHTPPPAPPQRTPPLLSRRTLFARRAALLALVAAALPLAACKTSWELENRETPVNVVLLAPAAAQAPQRMSLLVYVGDRKAVDGTVTFPQGTTRVNAPTVYVRSGAPTVSVVLDGRAVASSAVNVQQPTFVVITLTGAGATIASDTQDPMGAR